MVWTNEDGDLYFAEGHVSDEKMVALCIKFEQRCLGKLYPDPPELEDEIRSGTIGRFWIIDCEWNDEACHVVAEGTEGAQAITRLQR